MAAPQLTAYQQGQTVTSADRLNTFEQTCDNVSQLRGIIGVSGMQISIRGIASPNDGGAGVFYWNSVSTGPDDNINVIVPTGSAAGAWVRIVTFVSGAIAPYAFTTTAVLLTTFGSTISLSAGTLAITGGRTTEGDGGGGLFYYNSSDTTTADNGGTIRVDSQNRRWYALVTAPVNPLIFGARGDGTTNNNTALQNWLTWCSSKYIAAAIVQDPLVSGSQSSFLFTQALTVNVPALYMEPGTSLKVTGTGFTALTINNPGFFEAPWRIELNGPGNGASALNGVIWNNPAGYVVDEVRISGFNGYGLILSKMYDSEFGSISVQACGNSSNYAFSIVDGGDTSNTSHICRLQVEQANTNAISISPNTLTCVFDAIHSEQAVGNVSNITWSLQGNNCQYNTLRLQGDSNTNCTIGQTCQFTNLRTEGTIPVTVVTGNQLPLTLVNPNIFGVLGHLSGNFGAVTISGGSVGTIQSLTVGPYYCFGTAIGTFWTQTASPTTGATAQNRIYGGAITTVHVNGSYPTLNVN